VSAGGPAWFPGCETEGSRPRHSARPACSPLMATLCSRSLPEQVGRGHEPRLIETQWRETRLDAALLPWSARFGGLSKATPTVSNTASGCILTAHRSTLALPSGLRRPCSQFRRVATLIPIRAVNFG